MDLPLVDELAADIFMGQFSGKFLEAAQIAAKLLRGTLYARYYAIPVDRVLGLRDLKARRGRGPEVSAGFAALCAERADVKDGERQSPAGNGKIIEQEQILTTHNLAALWEALQLQPLLRARLVELAQACFRAICREQQVRTDKWRAKLKRVKNHAYAWRQMLFFLSLAGEADTERFLRWAEEHLGAQGEAFQRRFAPALRGLKVAARGGDLEEAERGGAARRLLGWSTGRHWLLTE